MQQMPRRIFPVKKSRSEGNEAAIEIQSTAPLQSKLKNANQMISRNKRATKVQFRQRVHRVENQGFKTEERCWIDSDQWASEN